MAGHSKWANIKHRKGTTDARRGKLFTRLSKEIIVAARLGGGDPSGNPRLRIAIQNAKTANIPKDNIERAIKKGTGAEVENYQEVTYEGNFGPVGIFIEATTDNTTRTVANIRSYYNKIGGSLGTNGSLAFIFNRKGVFNFTLPSTISPDELELDLIDAGAEEVNIEDNLVTVITSFEDYGAMQKKLEDMQIEISEAALQRIPNVLVTLDNDTFQKAMKLIDLFEDDDDIQKVYHNIDITEEQMELI
ncbi:YebC/PmpR family DNA-binding transcriptional regulator [Xanthocytophaga flava]|uniref:YebC/PmpR family DNA-binding transcriptional regulator n=1 Tax=Xanthocytophaga flava TaxID=3048013 RepID=UPI0028D60BB8|nr:YebC/PmpR family DNA-binding transcriptional regulator [Xanthocytophaga flavus]MDJ1468048.1 YebC/PmpR family DNA-binding transcriptional regulator [Xanthocytophaga flavus]